MALTVNDFDNAKLDLTTIEEVVNGNAGSDSPVATRLGQSIKTLAAAIASVQGFTSIVGWQSGISYNDFAVLVTNGGTTYKLAVAHVSGNFATDLAAGKWLIYYPDSLGTAAILNTVTSSTDTTLNRVWKNQAGGMFGVGAETKTTWTGGSTMRWYANYAFPQTSDFTLPVILCCKKYAGTTQDFNGMRGMLKVNRGALGAGLNNAVAHVNIVSGYNTNTVDFIQLSGGVLLRVVEATYQGVVYYGVQYGSNAAAIFTFEGELSSDVIQVTAAQCSSVTTLSTRNLAYKQSNIVGTVGQLEGSPTGSIIQRIPDTGNGEAVLFADGTLIINRAIPIPNKQINIARDNAFYATHTVTLPVTTVGNIHYSGSVIASGNIVAASQWYFITNSQIGVVLSCGASVTLASDAFLIVKILTRWY